jgi:hypothetical protein
LTGGSADRRIGGHDVHMEINSVDPRNQAWEIDQPSYRVYFHDPAGNSDEREITGGDVADVIAWVDAHRDGRTYVLYVCVPSDGLGLVRLVGADPHS